MNRSTLFALPVLLAGLAGVPQAASAGKVVRGFSSAAVLENQKILFSLILAGPLKAGVYQAGFKNKKGLRSAREFPLTAAKAGEFRNISVTLRVRDMNAKVEVSVQDPSGKIIGTYVTKFIPGATQETLMGRRKAKVVRTWYERRDADLKSAWVDDTGDYLAVEFYERIKSQDDYLDVKFMRGKKVMCGEGVPLNGAHRQVVRVRVHCRKIQEDAETEVTDDIVVEEDNYDRELTDEDLDSGAVDLKDALTLQDAVAEDGKWRVEIRRGKKRLKTLSFSVKNGVVKAGVKKMEPLKAAKVSR